MAAISHHHRTDTSEPLARQSYGAHQPKNMAAPDGLLHPHLRPIRAIPHRVVNVGLRDSTYVLDGLLYHESDLRIGEHY